MALSLVETKMSWLSYVTLPRTGSTWWLPKDCGQYGSLWI